MAMKIRWFLFTAVLFSIYVHAEDKMLPAPDPLALEASWWSYYSADEKIDKVELLARIDRTHKRLLQTLKGLNNRQLELLTPMVKKIHEGLKQYSSLTEASASDVLTIPPAAEKYSLEEALKRFQLWRKLNHELDLERDDLAWQRAQLTLQRKRQSQRRSDYLGLPASDPQRLTQGIMLMSSRVSLELATLQNKRRETKLKDATIQVQRLHDELDIIHQRLISAADDKQTWQKQQSSAKAMVESMRQQAGVPVSEQSPDTPVGSANIKRLLLKSAAIDVQISVHELAAMRYQMIGDLAQLVSESKTDPQATESLLSITKQFIDLKQSINEQKQSWYSLVVQARRFASAQISNNDRADQVLSEAYKQLLKQADDNDRLLRELDLEQDTGDFLLQLIQAKVKDTAGLFKGWQIGAETWIVKSWDQLGEWLNATLFEISEAPVTTMGLFRVLLIITIAWFISRVFRRGLDRLGQRKDGVSASSLYTLGRVIHYVILVVGVIIGLSSIGIDFTKFALFASALGVGIGFGLQNLISNFVAGLMILFEKSLKVGDFVELASGLTGEVKEINMRSTLITTNDNVDILVPNSEFVNNQVTNWTLRDTIRRIHVPFGVAYGTDKELVKKAVLEAAYAINWTLDDNRKSRQPQIWFVEFGDSSLNFELVVWLKADAVKRPGAVKAAYLWEIDTKLKQYGIEIPFPQRDLHLRSVFGQKDEAGLSLISKQNEPGP
jgi:small-conductance mechanosensitive channel